jgi:hypothetical protein
MTKYRSKKIQSLAAAALALNLSLNLTTSSMAAPASSLDTTGSIKIASKHKSSKASTTTAAPPKADNSDYVNAAPFIERMLKAADSYKDYVFEYEMTNYKGKKLIEKANSISRSP